MPLITEAEFRSAILPFTLHYEGGYSDDPHDPGNWTGGKVGTGRLLGTKFGIAASSHPALDIAGLTIDAASDLYWAEYVVRPGFAALSLPLLQVVFDAGVNCGPARARAWLALAASKGTIEAQIAAFTALNLAFHRSLKTWPRYGTGWGARIAACEKRALTLIAAAPVAIAAPQAPPEGSTLRFAPRAASQPQASLWLQAASAAWGTVFPPVLEGC